MALEITQSVIVNCDGPDCDVETTVPDSTQIPTDWISMHGPAHYLGRFYFHSGACYDRWKANVDAFLASQET